MGAPSPSGYNAKQPSGHELVRCYGMARGRTDENSRSGQPYRTWKRQRVCTASPVNSCDRHRTTPPDGRQSDIQHSPGGPPLCRATPVVHLACRHRRTGKSDAGFGPAPSLLLELIGPQRCLARSLRVPPASKRARNVVGVAVGCRRLALYARRCWYAPGQHLADRMQPFASLPALPQLCALGRRNPGPAVFFASSPSLHVLISKVRVALTG
jgi:hypothetical protein